MLDRKYLQVERSSYIEMCISFLESDYFWRLQALLTNHRLKCLLVQEKKRILRTEVTKLHSSLTAWIFTLFALLCTVLLLSAHSF